MARWPKYVATENHRRQVLTMAGFGIKHADIARVMRCDAKTLRKFYRDELDTGMTEANVRVAQSLFEMATKHKIPAAAIFWLKARAGWRDRPDADGDGGAQDFTFLHLIAAQASGEQLRAALAHDDAAKTIDHETSEAIDIMAPALE